MANTIYQKGKFYSLPIINIVEIDGNAYFQVSANDREYMIRMFDFQRKDTELRGLKDLPVMVKDVRGEDILFVQNFARMFGKDYKEDESYPFTVQNQGMTEVDGQFFYNVRDSRGVIFKLTTPPGVFLMAQQRIYCKVRKTSPDRLTLEYDYESKRPQTVCVTPDELLARSRTTATMTRQLKWLFRKSSVFAEARELLRLDDPKWLIKAIMAVPDYWISPDIRQSGTQMLVGEYIRLCLFLLEESKLLLGFQESERENYQDWIARKIRNAEIYSEVLEMAEDNRLEKEIDAILHKIRNSGFIYRPDHKIAILIAIFSIRPSLLEERIDAILDIIEDTNWSRRNPEFRKAFCLFMTYYIDTNREEVNRTALVNDESSNRLLSRMIRAISYLLLMTDDEATDLPLYRSLLYHYLSYVRYNNTVGIHRRGIVPSESLLERAFQALMGVDSGGMDLNWNSDIKQSEVFAYRMSVHPMAANMPTTRSLESDTVRFSVNNNNISIAPAFSKDSYQNVVPGGILDWHQIQIYLPNSGRYSITRNASIKRWKEWWSKVEQALFTKEQLPMPKKRRKFMPEVGQEVTIRIVSKDDSNPLRPYRYRCRIEDSEAYGEGWIDIYGVKASTGMFRYIPEFDLDCFYYEGEPLLIKARINSIVDSDTEKPTFMFDAMGLLEEFVKDTCEYGEESDSRIILHDEDRGYMLAVSERGYGLFIPDKHPDMTYGVGDTVKVRLTDISKPSRIQAEAIGPADQAVNIREAAYELLVDYCEGKTFQETEDQLAKDALSLSDDQFEPAHIQQMIAILDHKALMEEDRASAYGYLSIAHILAKMTSDSAAIRYLEQRLRILVILEEFGKNERVDNDEFELLSAGNEDFINHYPLLKDKLCQIKIVDSMGRQERNRYLWQLTEDYSSAHLIGKLARLMLSYNISDGMQLSEFRAEAIEKIKRLLNIRISVPKIYSFGEEGQQTEFKTSIVFPPDQGMKPNKEVQTFNILKVIAGMANAYGGTLYLGVYDTGTAKGLEDDLVCFDGSKDKYKNYLRNQIRVAMGGAFNATITEEFPEAGDKWIYALRIRPSKMPVGIKHGDETLYFLREGASTYLWDDVGLLQEFMDRRAFADYGIQPSEISDSNLETEQEADQNIPSAVKPPVADHRTASESASESIATGILRPNIVNEWEEGYGVDTCGFIRINDDNTWSLLDEVKWTDGLMTLAISNSERNGWLILVYEDGETQRVSINEMLKASLFARNRMRHGQRPVFICPAKDSDALLVVYKDTKGQPTMRLDDISRLSTVRIHEPGDDYPDCNLQEILKCEILEKEHHESLKPLHNMKTNSSYPTNHHYGQTLRQALADLGIELPD